MAGWSNVRYCEPAKRKIAAARRHGLLKLPSLHVRRLCSFLITSAYLCNGCLNGSFQSCSDICGDKMARLGSPNGRPKNLQRSESRSRPQTAFLAIPPSNPRSLIGGDHRRFAVFWPIVWRMRASCHQLEFIIGNHPTIHCRLCGACPYGPYGNFLRSERHET